MYKQNLKNPSIRERKRRRKSIREEEEDVNNDSLKPYPRRKIQIQKGKSLLDLPEHIILGILMRVGIVDVIFTVPRVCSSWHKLSKHPLLYRSIVIGANDPPVLSNTPYSKKANWKSLIRTVKVAVDRSCGMLVEFSCGKMCNFEIEDISYVILNSLNTLKSIRMGICIMVHNAREIVELVKNVHSLEELYFSDDSVTKEGIKQIGSGCPKLKFFSLGVCNRNCDDKAFAIASSMPSLQRLFLYGNGLTSAAVHAILKGCPCLEYLYIKGFSNFEADVLTKYGATNRIKSIQILAKDTKVFGQEYEFHLKTSIDKHDISSYSPAGDYGFGDYTLSLYKAPFEDIEVPFYC